MGDIKFWDIRNAQSIKTIECQGGMSALAIHDYAPLIAWFISFFFLSFFFFFQAQQIK